MSVRPAVIQSWWPRKDSEQALPVSEGEEGPGEEGLGLWPRGRMCSCVGESQGALGRLQQSEWRVRSGQRGQESGDG